MLDSGATNNVQAVKKQENYEGLVPIEVEVAFDSEVKAELLMNPYETIIGPEGTETIASMHEVVKAGYGVDWKKGNSVVTKGEIILTVEVRSGTNEICLELIDKIERSNGKR